MGGCSKSGPQRAGDSRVGYALHTDPGLAPPTTPTPPAPCFPPLSPRPPQLLVIERQVGTFNSIAFAQDGAHVITARYRGGRVVTARGGGGEKCMSSQPGAEGEEQLSGVC